MAELNGSLYAFEVYSPGNPNFPTGLPGPLDPIGLRLLDQDAFVAEKDVAGQVGPSGKRTLNGVMASHNDWFLDRFWITPSPIEFGSIVGSKTIQVSVFNTHDRRRVLNSLDISAITPGVSVGDGAPPRTLDFLQAITIDLEATAQGAPSFSANVVFSFDESETVEILATGRRLILFWYEPEQPLSETLTWRTDIIQTRDGNESRDSLRTTPRQVLQFRISGENEREVSTVRSLLLAFRPFLFGVPIWFEQRRVTAALTSGNTVIQVDTTNADHRVGGSVMVFEPATREAFDAEIDSFTDTSITLAQPTTVDISADAIITPLRFGYITGDVGYNDAFDNYWETTVAFETTDNEDLAFADQAALEAEFSVHPEDSLPILSSPNKMDSNRQRRTQQTPLAELDRGIGQRQLIQTVPRGAIVGQSSTLTQSEAEIRRMRAFLHWLRGSWGAFYLPTFRNDLPPVSNFQLDTTNIVVEDTGLFAQNIGVQDPRKSIMLELPDGRQFFAEVASVASSGDNEALTLVAAFDSGSTEVVDFSTARISWLELVRVEGDTATLLHQRVGLADVRFQTRTIQR